jgi:hypothetical protein
MAEMVLTAGKPKQAEAAAEQVDQDKAHHLEKMVTVVQACQIQFHEHLYFTLEAAAEDNMLLLRV